MKKTIIAAAIATVVAAPAAMADVSVSGAVKLTIVDNDNTNNYGPSFNGSELTFKASEDLGNGMSAFAQTTFNNVNAGTAGDPGYKDVKLGVKGSFGTVAAGRMETLTEGAVSSMMDDGAITHGASTQLESGLTSIGRVNAIAYVSPTVNGFHVAAAGTLNGADDSVFEHNDIAAVYANGPLTIKAAHVNFDGANDTTTIGASYKAGDLKVSAMRVDQDDTDLEDTMVRLDYSMGNNIILVGNKDSDNGSDMNVVKLTHKLSGRTAVWVGHRDKDSADDVTHFGMIHKF